MKDALRVVTFRCGSQIFIRADNIELSVSAIKSLLVVESRVVNVFRRGSNQKKQD